MKNKISATVAIFISYLLLSGCGLYSFTGASTAAESIVVSEFFNNTDLAPANIAQNFTNDLKDYYQRNSSLRVVQENGQLRIEGTITDYRISPIAPVSSGSPNAPDAAALTRLTIAVQCTYEDSLEPTNSFKSKSFSFYADYDNNRDFTSVQEELEKTIFDQILLDIFNATIANW